ncbi:hypothetical protein [Gordonia sp. NPDC127522]|uniref:hypothetical protein n=1 Tax=Gordonia sp. NPDC127522 TaxID=3345390 RepID=UPI00362DC8D1
MTRIREEPRRGFGEALALTTDDVIVEHNEHGEVDCVRLLVTRSVVEGAGLERVAGPTKTDAGQRGIVIFGRDAEAIARHVARLAPGALLWTGQNGNYVSQSSVINWWWKAQALPGALTWPSIAAPLRGHPLSRRVPLSPRS